MSEFIGSQISLISKSDIRYVGTLVEINSEKSTVSLDNVRSFGTEGRKGGKDEYAPSSAVYEQIVFRGSDVKDLRIEEPAKDKAPQPPMPDDPAIIGVQQQSQSQPQPRQERAPNQPRPQEPQNFPPVPQGFPQGYPPYGGPHFQNRFPPQGGFPGGPPPFPGPGPGYGMAPYGAPPGWYGPGQGFNQPPGPFNAAPIGPPGQQNQNQPPPGPKGGAAPIGPPVSMEDKPKVAEADGAAKPAETKSASKSPAPGVAAKQPPPPPVDSKPDVAAALAPPPVQPVQSTAPKTAPTGPRSGRIIPAVPLPSPGMSKTVPVAAQPSASSSNNPPMQPATSQQTYQSATQAATAAVAAAMAKLEVGQGKAPTPNTAAGGLDNLTRRVNEMRADDQIRHGRQPGTGGYAAGHRGGRGGGRGRGGGHQNVKIEVPATDFDFASANAKFNKQDLVKEAIASGSPLGADMSSPPTADLTTNGHANGAAADADKEVEIPPAAYDKTSSFFDNISSELKDRDDAASRRGQEFRTEERRKNMETFGQGSVDGYRGGYRGRGRGRGRGGRGYGFRGRGGAPRGRGGAQTAAGDL
ncbi:hypothetical protein EJ04DRAFT_249435 [Polyplosphaeria fusca]|uniref:Uncharacterized protein n=1 Tax=Polyplosphaeria fusca TaxID=682080 RepID=A0A9P4UZE7_9PLEO|nr:hypothetical protein EJ04DRAFT_249435 [Polyplosphaeria fusca]